MIVVTGAAGFIGSNIVAELNARGRSDIVICDTLGLDGRWMNLRKRLFRLHLFPGELWSFLDRERPDAVLHMGANSSTTTIDGDAILCTNFRYTLKLVDRCAVAGIPLIYASSAATYGSGEHGYVDDFRLDALRRLRPLNVYGWSKHILDQIVCERAELGLSLPPKCIGLKFFNVYGPNEDHKGSMMSVVRRAYPAAAAGEPVKLFRSHRTDCADGEQQRDFVYVEDVVDATLWFLENGPTHGVFNIGTGSAASFRRFVEALFAAVGRPTRIEYVPIPEAIRDKYQFFTEASLESLRRTGYRRPFRAVEEGVAAYVRTLASGDPFR